MRYCLNCSHDDMIVFDFGSCGGLGQKIGCAHCQSIFQKTSGGLRPTSDQWQETSYIVNSFDSYHQHRSTHYRLKVAEELLFDFLIRTLEGMKARIKILNRDKVNLTVTISMIGELQTSYLIQISEQLGSIAIEKMQRDS